MTQRNEDIPRSTHSTLGSSGMGSVVSRPDVSITQSTVMPADRVRWGPIWAGIFAAISTMILLGLLGLAIGLSAYDVTDTTRGFGVGAGIWQILTVIAAFFVGGWVAGRSAGIPVGRTGWLNGALVWAVTIPLALLILTGGLTRLISGVSGPAAQMVSNTNTQDNQPRMLSQQPGSTDEVTGTARDIVSGQRQPSEQTVDSAQTVAWWTFASFALGLGAAGFGGYAGAQVMRRPSDDVNDRHTPTV